MSPGETALSVRHAWNQSVARSLGVAAGVVICHGFLLGSAIREIRLGDSPRSTRLIIESTAPLGIEEPIQVDPEGLVIISLQGVEAAGTPAYSVDPASGIRSVRFLPWRSGLVAAIRTKPGLAHIQTKAVHDPERLLIDLHWTGAEESAASPQPASAGREENRDESPFSQQKEDSEPEAASLPASSPSSASMLPPAVGGSGKYPLDLRSLLLTGCGAGGGFILALLLVGFRRGRKPLEFQDEIDDINAGIEEGLLRYEQAFGTGAAAGEQASIR